MSDERANAHQTLKSAWNLIKIDVQCLFYLGKEEKLTELGKNGQILCCLWSHCLPLRHILLTVFFRFQYVTILFSLLKILTLLKRLAFSFTFMLIYYFATTVTPVFVRISCICLFLMLIDDLPLTYHWFKDTKEYCKEITSVFIYFWWLAACTYFYFCDAA